MVLINLIFYHPVLIDAMYFMFIKRNIDYCSKAQRYNLGEMFIFQKQTYNLGRTR